MKSVRSNECDSVFGVLRVKICDLGFWLNEIALVTAPNYASIRQLLRYQLIVTISTFSFFCLYKQV